MSKSVQLLNGLLFRPRSEYRTAVVNTATNNNSPQVLVKNSELVKKLRDLKFSDKTYFTVKYNFFPFMHGIEFWSNNNEIFYCSCSTFICVGEYCLTLARGLD